MPEETAGPVLNPPLAGRYELGELLGRGAMAEVYQAEDVLLRRQVAVKLFHGDSGPTGRQRFGEEVRALTQLAHPALVSIHDAGLDGTRPFLVMRLVPGGNLNERLDLGPLSPAEVVRLGATLAEAVDHVHGRGIVHRDIKPSNILLGEHGEPYLADFGIAHLAGTIRLTSSGEVVGTAAYLAPEQITGHELTPAIDVYELGLVLLECLTGEPAYPGATKAEAALARLHRSPHIPDTVPSGLATLLASMTDLDPGRRPTAKQCAGLLHAIDTTTSAYTASIPPSDHPTVPALDRAAARTSRGTATTRRPFARRRAFLAGSGVAVAVVAGLILLLSAPGAGFRRFPGHAVPDGPGPTATTSPHNGAPATAVTGNPAVAGRTIGSIAGATTGGAPQPGTGPTPGPGPGTGPVTGSGGAPSSGPGTGAAVPPVLGNTPPSVPVKLPPPVKVKPTPPGKANGAPTPPEPGP